MRKRPLLLAAALLVAAVPVHPTPAAAAPADITSDIVAGRDVTLAGDAVVRLPAGETRYGGVISGEGTLTISGTGRLILTEDSDFILPERRQRQRVETGTSGDSYAVTTIRDPDPPAVVVERGATLQYAGGLTKVGDGALTLTGVGATPGGAWTVEAGELRLGGEQPPGAVIQASVAVAEEGGLAGAGRVDGDVTTAGVIEVTGPLAVVGDFTQTGSGALRVATGGGPLSVAGAVRLAGGLDLAAGGIAAGAAEASVLENRGPGPVEGTFQGLPEGATVTVAGLAYRISYHGGDGNDVVLTADAPGTAGGLAAYPGGTGGAGGWLLSGVAAVVLATALGLGWWWRRRRRGSRLAHNRLTAGTKRRHSGPCHDCRHDPREHR